LIPVYDPATTAANPNFNSSLPPSATNQPYLSQQFMGCTGNQPNVICSTDSRLVNSLAAQWFKYTPTPNLPGIINNYAGPAVSAATYGTGISHRGALVFRIDHYMGEKDHFAATAHLRQLFYTTATPVPPQISSGAVDVNGGGQTRQLRLSWDHTISPTLLNTATFGYNVIRFDDSPIDLPYAGALPQITGVQSHIDPPTIDFQNFSGYGTNGWAVGDAAMVYDFNDMATWVKGKHTLKFGGEVRHDPAYNTAFTNPSGTFNFSQINTGLVTPPAGTTSTGSDMASFELEQVNNALINWTANTATETSQHMSNLFAGDTWKTTRKLSVNYGLRWDFSPPAYEKWNRLTFLDPNGANTGAGGRPGRLAFSDSKNTLNGTEYGAAGFQRRTPETTSYRAFGPRLGIAYAWSNRTVVRTGYGIFFEQSENGGWGGWQNMDGFNATISFASSNSGLTAPFLLNQGVPQTFTKPPAIDPTFDNGNTAPYYREFDANRHPYVQQWNLTIEHQFTNNFYISAAYVGNKGTRLISVDAPINTINPSLLSMGQSLFDQFTPGETSLDGVAAPYAGWAAQMKGCPPTVAQALSPYPQYCGVIRSYEQNAGNSTYHSFQFKAEKRLSHKTWLLLSYTNSKTITNADTVFPTALLPNDSGSQATLDAFSPYQRRRGKSLSVDDVPQNLSLSFMYLLPFGKGERFVNRGGAVDKLIGGWQLVSIFHDDSGTPFPIRSSFCNVPSQVGALCIPGELPGANPFLQSPSSFDPAKGPMLNKAAFQSSSTFNFNLGQGLRVTNLRGPGYHNQDLTFMKDVKIVERVGLEFRAEMFNVWNWHMFTTSGNICCGAPSAVSFDVASPNFGLWNGNVTNPRVVQFAMKVLF
jgi:hypothetical protein